MSKLKDTVAELACKAVETSAPLSSGAYRWYSYKHSRAIKITSGKGSYLIKNNTKFGAKPAAKKDSIAILFEEDGKKHKLILAGGQAELLISRSTDMKVQVKPKGLTKVNQGVEDHVKEAKAVVKVIIPQVTTDNLTKDLVAWLKTTAKQADKIDKVLDSGKDASKLLANFPAKKAPKRKAAKAKDAGNGNVPIAVFYAKYVVRDAKASVKNIEAFENVRMFCEDLALMVEIYPLIAEGRAKQVNKKLYSKMNHIVDTLPNKVLKWVNDNS